MSTEDMEIELGQATIVYEGPDGDRVEETVENEKILYARDHWVLLAGSDDQGNDLMRQIPRGRVHRVERNVEQFEEEAATLRHRVESIADDLRQRLPGALVSGGDRHHTEEPPSESTTVQIDAGEPEHEDEAEGEGEETTDRSESQY